MCGTSPRRASVLSSHRSAARMLACHASDGGSIPPGRTMNPTLAKKKAQLGMDAGTANGRLLRMLLFDMARRLGEDVCFRCGGRIEAVRELSVEHKLPWLDEDPALFWDLANVAFSHLGCNVRAAKRPRKVDYPEGQKWCRKCKEFRPVDEFPECAQANRSVPCSKCESARRLDYRVRSGHR